MSQFWRIAVVTIGLATGRSELLASQDAASGARSSQPSGIAGPVAPRSQATGSGTPVEVTGHVLNGRTRQPIARALVQFGGRRVLTDHDGVFRFAGVTTAGGSFRVSKPGFFPGSNDVPPVYSFVSDSAIDLTLYPEAILFGRVIDSTGEPVPHLQVRAMRGTYHETGHHWFFAGESTTLSDGSYRISLPAGEYAVLTRTLGRPVAGEDMLQPVSIPANPTAIRQAIHLAAGDEVRLDPRPSVRRTYQVLLRMEGSLERGLPMVTARSVNEAPMTLRAVPDGADRQTLHVALPNGTYEIVAEMQTQDAHMQGRTMVTVAGHDMLGMTVALTPVPMFPVVIEVDSSARSDNTSTIPKPQQLGLVFSSVASTADFNDPVFPLTSRGTAQPSFSLSEGTYQLHAVGGGAWYVTSATCGGTDLLQQNLTVGAGAGGAAVRVRISNQTGDLTGTARQGEAAVSAWIYLIATAPSATPIVSFRAGSAGSFRRPNLAPGTYRVFAAEQQITADLQSGETLSRLGPRVQTLTVNAGDHAEVSLQAIPAEELNL